MTVSGTDERAGRDDYYRTTEKAGRGEQSLQIFIIKSRAVIETLIYIPYNIFIILPSNNYWSSWLY